MFIVVVVIVRIIAIAVLLCANNVELYKMNEISMQIYIGANATPINCRTIIERDSECEKEMQQQRKLL